MSNPLGLLSFAIPFGSDAQIIWEIPNRTSISWKNTLSHWNVKGLWRRRGQFFATNWKMGWYLVGIVFVGSKKCGILNVLWCLTMICGFKIHTKIWLNSPFEITAKKTFAAYNLQLFVFRCNKIFWLIKQWYTCYSNIIYVLDKEHTFCRWIAINTKSFLEQTNWWEVSIWLWR